MARSRPSTPDRVPQTIPRRRPGRLRGRRAGPEVADQLPRECGPSPGFLVLEVHERVSPVGSPGGLRPAGQLIGAVGAIPETKVPEICRRDDRRSSLLRVGDAKRRVPGPEDLVYLVVEPRRVAKLDGHPDRW